MRAWLGIWRVSCIINYEGVTTLGMTVWLSCFFFSFEARFWRLMLSFGGAAGSFGGLRLFGGEGLDSESTTICLLFSIFLSSNLNFDSGFSMPVLPWAYFLRLLSSPSARAPPPPSTVL